MVGYGECRPGFIRRRGNRNRKRGSLGLYGKKIGWVSVSIIEGKSDEV
jgi:hypothetical protein